MQNAFSKVMQAKTIVELIEVVKNPDRYQDEALSAAQNELSSRGVTSESEMENLFIKEDYAVEISGEIDCRPSIYPRWSITVFTLVFSPIVSSIMLAISLDNIGKKRSILDLMIVSTGMYAISLIFIYMFVGTGLWARIISVMFGLPIAFVMDEFFWKKNIIRPSDYRRSSLKEPLIIGVIINVALNLLLRFSG
ncbi:MAG: hypothetical protein RIC80_22210 [Cyclobacteriaceae bacterium]